MNNIQQDRVRRLAANGFSLDEIKRLTRYSHQEINEVLHGPAFLRRIARRMLRRIPSWWEQGEASWRHCVTMNFRDCLPEEEWRLIDG